MKTYSNGFERAVYAIHPPTKSIYRSLAATHHDDRQITVNLPDSWLVEIEDTSLHSRDWDDDGFLTQFANKHGVDKSWTTVSRQQAEMIS